MPLAISLRPNERLVVNGVVLQNSGTPAKLLIHNNASVLREKYLIARTDATTPARRIYFAIQCGYLFPGKDSDYPGPFHQLIEEFGGSEPDTAALAREIKDAVDRGAFYHALKLARQLILREQEMLNGPAAAYDGGAAPRRGGGNVLAG